MKKIIFTAFVVASALFTSCDNAKEGTTEAVEVKPVTVDTTFTKAVDGKVEAGCGMCTFNVEGVNRCETWIKVEGKVFPLAGVEYNAHTGGLCSPDSKQASVAGEVKEGKFTATKFEISAADIAENPGHE